MSIRISLVKFRILGLACIDNEKLGMRILMISIWALLVGGVVKAQEADTTWVQTFTWEEQNNPSTAYDSPGRRWFQFPNSDNDTSYQKILMYYNLKCFEQGTAGGLGYACGEWDYLTYTYLFDHTGDLDSNLLTHPRWLVDDLNFEVDTLIMNPIGGAPADTLRYFWPSYELNMGASYAELESIAEDWSQLEWLSGTGSNRGRMQWLWTAEELASAGWDTLSAAGLELPALAPWADSRDAAQWKTYWTDVDSLEGFLESTPISVSMVSDLMHPGRFIFNEPLDWDGVSNLVVELLVKDEAVGFEEEPVACMLAPNRTWQAGTAGEFIRFDGNDRLEVAANLLDGIEGEVTVEFWQRGNSQFQPENNSICEGMNANNQRELNIHLPWSNGRIYWDAGFDGGYDRIDQAATADQYEGKWNHWAFSKDANTGVMAIYFNGNLWHSGADKDNAFGEMVRFHIGCNGNGGNDYRGDVDEFRMWSAFIEPEVINAYYNRRVDENHPHLGALLLDLRMDHNESLGSVGDAQDSWNHGNAGAYQYRPVEAFIDPGPMPGNGRPAITWWFGEAEEGELVTVDEPIRRPATSLSEWEVNGNAVSLVNMSYGWPHDLVTQTRSVDGDILAIHALEGEATTFTNDTLSYYSPAFEVVDRYELARFITPYGIGLTLGEDGWTWIFDVTDYAHLLRDSVQLEAGNWQELLDMKFAFVHGTPPRDVKRMDAFWKGTYYLNSFDGNVTDHAFTPEADETMFKLKTRASGHGFGSGNNCAEFCYNTHSVKVNGAPQWSWEVMRECADNPLYPQGGTWIYDRAAWCPGAPVDTKEFELTPLVEGQSTFSVDYDITYDPDGNYRFEGQIVAYGSPNMQHDVEISHISSPSDDKLESRWNPICESPKVIIRNNGSNVLNSCVFTYSISGGEEATYEWSGNLNFMESTEVLLPYDDPVLWEGDDEEWLTFYVAVNDPNGQVDEEPRNNASSSKFHRVPTWSYPELDDNRLIVWTKTNLVPWETSVELVDAAGNVVWERGYPTANMTYRDTLSLNQGCYRFTINDLGDDGQGFWANSDGSGYTRLKKVQGGNFINFEPDFGKYISQAFYFQTNLVHVQEELSPVPVSFEVFPNPSDGLVKLRAHGLASGESLVWKCYDVMGRLQLSGTWVYQVGQLGMIHLNGVLPGTYALSLERMNGTRTTELIQIR